MKSAHDLVVAAKSRVTEVPLEQAEQAILHENAESQNESLDDLKQPGAVPSAAVPTSPPANPR